MKNKPNKLNLYEMWELYNLIGEGFNNEYLIDESVETLKSLDPQKIKKVLQIIYKDFTINNPLDIGILFIKGLKMNYFFDFQYLIRNLNGNPRD